MTDLIVAVPDLHGRLDLLDKALACLEGMDAEVVFLGDYIDRGPDSKGVVQRLIEYTQDNPMARAIGGNHEWFLVSALRGRKRLNVGSWLNPRTGGAATMLSYGLTEADLKETHRDILLEAIRSVVPMSHYEWLYHLPACVDTDKHIFVHAGLNPRKSMFEQDEEDVLWIRGPFHNVDHDFGKHVVYGHTIWEAPNLREHSTGLDLGSWRTGRIALGVFSKTHGGGPVDIIHITED